MSYYRGDYYRGDYYRGDFFSSVFGGIKKIGGAILGATPAGQVVKAVGSALMKTPPRPEATFAQGAPMGYGISIGGPAGLRFGGFPEYPPGGVPPEMTALGPSAGTICNVKGFRANKSTYVTRGGGTSKWPRQIIVHPKGTECVKIRRMNVANPRALRRAARRAAGFVKLARRVIRWTAPKSAKRFAGFKTRRKKAA